MPCTVQDIADFLESWAPPATAQSYDNVGLQVGRPDAAVTKALVALDMTPDVLAEAKALGAELIITHHPLLFRPLKTLTPGALVPDMALALAEARIALYSIHTNLDAARDGVSFALAHSLGIKNPTFLFGLEDSLVKLVTFVPLGHEDAVREAMAASGAGRIGGYDSCSFSNPGTGRFRAGPSADPFIGTPGGSVEAVDEIRIEVEVTRWHLDAVVAALKKAHPYEEVAYDVFAVEQPFRDAGIGAVGMLAEPVPLARFMDTVCRVLGNPAVRFVGDPEAVIHRVAVCGGSGSDFIGLARKAEADAYVTSDVTYHRFFDVLGADSSVKMALIDPGHYESEHLTEALLQERLAERFPVVAWVRTSTRTAPVRTWVSGVE